MALANRRPARGLIHHSDRGSQCGSSEYQQLLQEHGIIASMSRRGNCWDNARAAIRIHRALLQSPPGATWQLVTSAPTNSSYATAQWLLNLSVHAIGASSSSHQRPSAFGPSQRNGANPSRNDHLAVERAIGQGSVFAVDTKCRINKGFYLGILTTTGRSRSENMRSQATSSRLSLDAETEVMKVFQIADYLNCHYRTVYNLVQQRKVPCFRLGGSWRFLKSEVDMWIAKGGGTAKS